MKRAIAIAVGGFTALALTACTENRNSIYRTVDMKDKSVITDAKQRIVLNTEGNVAYGVHKPDRVYCAEPSPDVAQALSTSFEAALKASVQGKGEGQISVARESAAAVAQLGERLATIQLLRDGFYRACEAYGNGAISDTTYAMMVSRIDEVMVTLLASELAATRPLATLQKISPEAREAKATEVEEKQKNAGDDNGGGEASTKASSNGGRESRASSDDEMRVAAIQDDGPAYSNADTLRIAADDGAKNPDPNGDEASSKQPSGNNGQESTAANAAEVAGIHRTYMADTNLDALLVACVSALDRSPPIPGDKGSGKNSGPSGNSTGEDNGGPGLWRTEFADICSGLFGSSGESSDFKNSTFVAVLDRWFNQRTSVAQRYSANCAPKADQDMSSEMRAYCETVQGLLAKQ